MDDREVNRERVIEDAIMRRPDKLGYPGARSIRNWRVALTCGRLDVGLLPIKGPKKLVLVEAKCVKAPDAASKVVGQLLMYYAGALTLGSEGLACLQTFADKKCARCSKGLACRSPAADKKCARDFKEVVAKIKRWSLSNCRRLEEDEKRETTVARSTESVHRA